MLKDLAEVIKAVQNGWGLAALALVLVGCIIYWRYKYGKVGGKVKESQSSDQSRTPADTNSTASPANTTTPPTETTPAVLAPQVSATDPATASAVVSTPLPTGVASQDKDDDDLPKTTGRVNNVTFSGNNNTVHNITQGDTIYEKSGKN